MYLISDFNYDASKEFVDFYLLNTIFLNEICKPDLYNGLDPIKGTGGLIGWVILLLVSLNFQIENV